MTQGFDTEKKNTSRISENSLFRNYKPSMSSSPDTTTFGVELEFVIAYRMEDTRIPGGSENTLGKAIVIPPGIPEYSAFHYVFEAVQTMLANALPANSNTRADLFSYAVLDNHAKYQLWQARNDYSIDALPNGTQIRGEFGGATWLGIEVTSPALYNRPESFAEVRRAIELLHENYWVMVSPAVCGMHVHVGMGADHISLRRLRRLGALLFASDRLLAQLHPQHRLTDMYCLGISLVSQVAQGQTNQEALETLRPTQRPVVEASPGLRTAIAANPGRDLFVPNFERKIRYGALTGYNYKPGNPFTIESLPGAHFNPPRPMAGAVREILSVTRPEALATLLEGYEMPHQRLNYNFANYNDQRYPDNPSAKRTIEFRQAAGTLNADEVILFAKVYLGLFEFASTTSSENLLSVIHRCIEASDSVSDRIDFDVLDLLASIGLVDELGPLQDLIIARPPAFIAAAETALVEVDPEEALYGGFDDGDDMFAEYE